MSYVKSIYSQLHAIPEPGLEEYKTSALIVKELRELGFEVKTQIANSTAVLATLDSGHPGPVLGVRADMDALKYEFDGRVEYRHTCGHDAHSSMVLAAGKAIMEEGIKRGKLVLIFQPAEELLAGAKILIESGELAELTHIIGIHIRPVQDCQLGEASAALWHSAAAPTQIEIHGLTSHGARPHLGINAIETAVHIANGINLIKANPNISHSIKVTKINAGSGAGNAIPQYASMFVDVRSGENDEMEKIIEKLKKAIEYGAQVTGAEVKYSIDFCPGADYSPEMIEINAKAIKKVLGEEGLVPDIINPGSEDFHFFTRELGIPAGYIGLGSGSTPGLHHPDMTFDLDALEYGQQILENVIREHLG